MYVRHAKPHWREQSAAHGDNQGGEEAISRLTLKQTNAVGNTRNLYKLHVSRRSNIKRAVTTRPSSESGGSLKQPYIFANFVGT